MDAALFDYARNKVAKLPRFDSYLYLGSVSPDGTRLICGWNGHPPLILNVETLDTIASLTAPDSLGQISNAQISPDGKWVVATARTSKIGGNGAIYQWDANTLQFVGKLEPVDSIAASLQFTFSYDSKFMVGWSGGKPVRIIALLSQQSAVGVGPGVRVANIQFAPNPASGVVRIDWGDDSMRPTALRVCDITGNIVLSVGASQLDIATGHEYILDVGDLPTGYYRYMILAGGHRHCGPLVVIR